MWVLFNKGVQMELMELLEAKATAYRMISKYGPLHAAFWAGHYAFNNHDEGDYGREYWLAVREEICSAGKSDAGNAGRTIPTA